MLKRTFGIIGIFILIVVGCSSARLPGTGGTNSVEVIEETGHVPIPQAVACYVCHKEDIPYYDFHAGYSNDCAECHITTTWMARDYVHPAWYLDTNHRTRCTRCHTEASKHNYTVYQCWGCHHQEDDVHTSHAKLGYDDISECIACHENVHADSGDIMQ